MTYSGSSANTLTGTTFVQRGDLVLNKSGTVNAIAGPLVIGDSRGDDADRVLYAATAGSDQIANASAVTVLSSGRLDLTAIPAGVNEVQTLTFGGTITGGTFTLTFNNYVTDRISYSSTPATLVANIQAALDALPTIGGGEHGSRFVVRYGLHDYVPRSTGRSRRCRFGRRTVAHRNRADPPESS